MKRIITIFLVLFSCTSNAATLSLSDSIELIAVNGVHVEFIKEVNLPSGQHFIEVRYAEMFETLSDSSDWVKSSSMYLSLNLEDDNYYQLSTLSYDSSEEAESFEHNPKLFISSESEVKREVKVMNMSKIMNDFQSSLLAE